MPESPDSFLHRVFAVIDARDSPGFAAFFAAQGVFRFGNAEAAVGRGAIQEFVTGFFSALEGIEHRVEAVRSAEGGWLYVHVHVRYRAAGGATGWIPALVALRQGDGGFAEYNVYCDPAPLSALLGGAG